MAGRSIVRWTRFEKRHCLILRLITREGAYTLEATPVWQIAALALARKSRSPTRPEVVVRIMGLPLQQSMQPLAEELEDFLEAAGVLCDDRSTLFHQRLVALTRLLRRRLVNIGWSIRRHRDHRRLVGDTNRLAQSDWEGLICLKVGRPGLCAF